jgi:N-acetylneuraminic acid mutarotase
MAEPRRPVSAWKLVAALAGGVVLLLGLAAVIVGAGPSLPGPPIRVVMGLADPTISACRPEQSSVRLPGGTAAGARWQALPPVSGVVDEMRAVVAAGRIYLVGGLETSRWGERFDSIGRLYRYEPASGELVVESRLPRRLDHVLAVGRGDSIYVVGGFEDGTPTSEVWRYDVRDRSWTSLAPLATPRGGLGGGIVGDKLYAVGGSGAYARPDTRDGTSAGYASMEVYDFAADRWSPGPPMPTPRHHVASAVAGGRLYVVGGRAPQDTSLSAAERLDPATGTWERLPPLPLGVGSLAGTSADGQVIVVGGGDEVDDWVTPATWTFDTHSRSWRRLADLTIARHSETAATLGRDVYVLAGSPCGGYGTEPRPERIAITELLG